MIETIKTEDGYRASFYPFTVPSKQQIKLDKLKAMHRGERNEQKLHISWQVLNMPFLKENYDFQLLQMLAWCQVVGRKVKALGNTEKDGMKHYYTTPYSFVELTFKYMQKVCSLNFRKGYSNLEKHRE